MIDARQIRGEQGTSAKVLPLGGCDEKVVKGHRDTTPFGCDQTDNIRIQTMSEQAALQREDPARSSGSNTGGNESAHEKPAFLQPLLTHVPSFVARNVCCSAPATNPCNTFNR